VEIRGLTLVGDQAGLAGLAESSEAVATRFATWAALPVQLTEALTTGFAIHESTWFDSRVRLHLAVVAVAAHSWAVVLRCKTESIDELSRALLHGHRRRLRTGGGATHVRLQPKKTGQ